MSATKTTTVHELSFHFNLAELSSTAWRTAERTGALSHMDYAEVQKFSELYDCQDLVVQQQRNMVELAGIGDRRFCPAISTLKTKSSKDLEAFRQHVMQLRALAHAAGRDGQTAVRELCRDLEVISCHWKGAADLPSC